jgi:two-component system, OmpR family, sensor kinase
VSLRARLLAAFAYVLVLLSVALVVPFALNLVRRIDAEVKAEATSQAQLIAASASGRLGDRRELRTLAQRASRAASGRVIVVDARGRLLADSAGSGLRSRSYASRPEVATALRGRPAQGERHSDELGEDLLFTAVPVVSGGRRAGAVRVTQSVEAVNDRKRRDVLVLGSLAVVALLLGVAVAWLLAGSLSRPLASLAAAARRVGRGELGARAPVEGSSEQREVARAFNAMTGRLGRALESQRTFVANASHQLRTPLTGLRLRLEAAGLKARDPGLREELAAAEAESERLAALLRDLLVLAREERPADPEAAESLARAAGAARERWTGPAEEDGHELEVEGDAGIGVRSAGDDLAAILDNLLENALRYSPPDTPVRMEWSRDGDGAVLAVLDRGPGIAAGERGAVFERFYRGEAARGTPGTGLGLAIVEALAARCGGSARLAARPGGGTRAEVRLPLAPLPAPAPAMEAAER